MKKYSAGRDEEKLFYDFLSVFGQKTSLYWMKDEFGQGLNVKMANDQV